LSVSVNISAPTFAQSDVVGMVERTLRETGLDGDALKLEITERVAMADAERASGLLRDLKTLGVRVSLDDFGTGYSSLSYLQRFPVDTLKVDRSFVSGLRDSDECRQIIGTILSLARTLKLEVVAEGTETADQVAYLDTLACGFAQGFFFSEPIAGTHVGRFIADLSAPTEEPVCADGPPATTVPKAGASTSRGDD
jgi:EAL domain-containing protein (putative c-di-GMP-specific phosphodiesterase class I)